MEDATTPDDAEQGAPTCVVLDCNRKQGAMTKNVAGAGFHDDDALKYNDPPGATALQVTRRTLLEDRTQLADRTRRLVSPPVEYEDVEDVEDEDVEDEHQYDEGQDDEEDNAPRPKKRTNRGRKKRRVAAQQNSPRSQLSTKMLSGGTIDVVAVFLGRFAVWLILALGFLGSALAAHGGAHAAAPLIPAFSWGGWGMVRPLLFFVNITSIIGLAVQLGLTLIQWKCRNNKLSPWWLGSIAIDAGLTYLGYRDVLVVMFLLVGLGIVMAHVLSIGVSLLGAILPEPFLIRD